MKIRYLIIISALFCTAINGQHSKKDLNNYFERLSNSRDKSDSLDMARCYRYIGLSYMNLSELDSSKTYLDSAYLFALELNSDKARGAIGNNLADLYSLMGKHELALVQYDTCRAIYERLEDNKTLAGILLNYGLEYNVCGDKKKAAEFITDAIELKESIPDSSYLAFYYVSLAELFENNDSSLFNENLQKAYALIRNKKFTTYYTNVKVYYLLGQQFDQKGEWVTAFAYFDSMYIQSVESDYFKGKVMALAEKAHAHLHLSQKIAAIQLLEESLALLTQNSDEFVEMITKSKCALVYLDLNDLDKALSLTQRAFELSIKNNYVETNLRCNKLFADIYGKRKVYNLAYHHLKAYHNLNDSIHKNKDAKALQNLHLKYETLKKDSQLKMYEERHAHELKTRLLNTYLIITLILIVFGIVIIARYRRMLLKKALLVKEKEANIEHLEQEKLRVQVQNKSREITSVTLEMEQKNSLINSTIKSLSELDQSTKNYLGGIKQELQNSASTNNDWGSFKKRYEEVHPKFFTHLKKHFPNLTQHEEKLCAYLRLNLTSKEIAQLFNNTTSAVDKGRNRLRKKLNLTPEVNLYDFLQHF